MALEQIRRSIETRELKLGTWARLMHFGIVWFLFLIPVMLLFFHLKDHFSGSPIPLRESEIWLTITVSVLGLLFYRLQKNRLKFRSFDTSLTRAELDSIIEKVAKELEWKTYLNNPKVIIAKTHPAFSSGSWGEQITILFDENRVLVNSICDPDKSSSVISMGRNKQNMDRVIEEIQKASHQANPSNKQ